MCEGTGRMAGDHPIGRRCNIDGDLVRSQDWHTLEYLPPELGCGSGMICCRRLPEWMQVRTLLTTASSAANTTFLSISAACRW